MKRQYKIRMKTYHVAHEPTTNFGAITGPEDVAPLFKAILRDACDADRESTIVIGLNARGHATSYKIVSVGSLTASLIHPREVFSAAIVMHAAAIIIGHSHPSQDATPSNEDLALTERLVQAGELLGIPVLEKLRPEAAIGRARGRSKRVALIELGEGHRLEIEAGVFFLWMKGAARRQALQEHSM